MVWRRLAAEGARLRDFRSRRWPKGEGMHMSELAARWRDLAARLGLSGDVAAAGRDLLDRYAEPHRHYHTVEHLAECLERFDEYRALAGDADVVELALWFHDAVYVVGAGDNEARSADLARSVLASLGLGAPRVAAVAALVEATDHRGVPAGPDAQLIRDVDLAILGAAAARYRAYAAAIRREAGLPPDVFACRRGEFLRQMCARPVLFHTAALRATCEAAARGNMGRELEELGPAG